jgi:hypothetical protein
MKKKHKIYVRAKNKRAGKRATTKRNQSLSKTQKPRGHSLRDQSITRHVSVYSLRRFLSLSLRSLLYGLEVNQNECRQAGKLRSRLKKIRKNHALRLRDWFARSRSASRRCERKNTQKTALDAPLISARSAASSLSPVRSMTSACDMMEYGVGAPSF